MSQRKENPENLKQDTKVSTTEVTGRIFYYNSLARLVSGHHPPTREQVVESYHVPSKVEDWKYFMNSDSDYYSYKSQRPGLWLQEAFLLKQNLFHQQRN